MLNRSNFNFGKCVAAIYNVCHFLRDWSLIIGREGATKREGGHVRFYPYKKFFLAMLKGGGTTSFGVVFTW